MKREREVKIKSEGQGQGKRRGGERERYFFSFTVLNFSLWFQFYRHVPMNAYVCLNFVKICQITCMYV